VKILKNFAKKLEKIVDDSVILLNKISDNDWAYKSDSTKWSKKEILGHLIDSAANNHHRFVRVQYEDNPTIAYEQSKWVAIQNYKLASVEKLVNLWATYNIHLADIISAIPEEKHNNTCDIKKEKPVTLIWIVEDYIKHTNHHLAQIINN
jgi:predicted RNA-binding protein with PUA domain